MIEKSKIQNPKFCHLSFAIWISFVICALLFVITPSYAKKPAKVTLLIINSKSCKVCNTEKVAKYLKAQFPGLGASYLDYPADREALKLIKDLELKTLPVYLLGREAEKEKTFAHLKENVEIKGEFYMLKPSFGGIAYFLERKPEKGKLDVFISLYNENIKALLEMVREFQPTIHFLAVRQDDKFEAAAGNFEVEEYLRCVCVQKYYPEEFFNYLSCRANNMNSLWWDDCLSKKDTEKIKACARNEEGANLLEENIKLNKDLGIMFGPTYLLDNHEIFGIQGVPPKEEFKKLIEG